MAKVCRAYEMEWALTVLALRCEVEWFPALASEQLPCTPCCLEQAQPLLGNWFAWMHALGRLRSCFLPTHRGAQEEGVGLARLFCRLAISGKRPANYQSLLSPLGK